MGPRTQTSMLPLDRGHRKVLKERREISQIEDFCNVFCISTTKFQMAQRAPQIGVDEDEVENSELYAKSCGREHNAAVPSFGSP